MCTLAVTSGSGLWLSILYFVCTNVGYAHTGGPWSSKLAEDSSDEDSPHLLRTKSLHLDHSLSSSNDNEGTHIDSGEHALLRDEL